MIKAVKMLTIDEDVLIKIDAVYGCALTTIFDRWLNNTGPKGDAFTRSISKDSFRKGSGVRWTRVLA